MAGNRARLAGGAAAAAILAVIVIALFPRLAPQAGFTDAGAPPTDDATEAPPDATAAATMTAPTAADAADDLAVASPGPTVDTFLLGPDGVAVVAGPATPGARVTLLLDGAPLAQVQADASGSFAATAEVAASDAPRSLTFAENDAAPTGEAVLVRPGAGAVAVAMNETEAGNVTMPVDPVGSGPAVAADDRASADASDPTVNGASVATNKMSSAQDATSSEASAAHLADGSDAQTDAVVANAGPGAGDAASAPATAAGGGVDAVTDTATDRATSGAAAPTIVVDAQGARVIGPGPQVMDRVALDAITYDAAGAVQLAGRAPGNGILQVYVNNRPVTTGPVGSKGDWRLTLPDVDPGTYTLRIDALAADGTVASRVETPFKREDPQDVTAFQADDGGMTVATRTVQPGNTLWAIARDNLGEGLMYVRLFAANADQIRDPDLIYPGQVFVIPQP